MFGDYLRNNINLLITATEKKTGEDAFWNILKRIAVKDILAIYPSKVDSDIAIPVYYNILSENANLLPYYYRKTLPSNKQERFRVVNRNLWSTNAFHPDGLGNQKEVKAFKEINESKKGSRVVYQGVEKYVDKK